MLHYKTIERSTLDLLKTIQGSSIFEGLRLVGGTALALQIGHRKSIDLDFFGHIKIDKFALNEHLAAIGDLKIIKQSENIHIFTINGIKVDFVNYPYPWLCPSLVADEIILADIEDIIPMKLSAITNRGTKKDFIDIYYLLSRYSLTDMLNLYNTKYSDGSSFLVLKSLVYFEDADDEIEPVLFEQLDWDKIKVHITKSVEEYLQK